MRWLLVLAFGAGCQGPLQILHEAGDEAGLFRCQPHTSWTKEKVRTLCGAPERQVRSMLDPDDPGVCDVYRTRALHAPQNFDEIAVCYETRTIRSGGGFVARDRPPVAEREVTEVKDVVPLR